MFARAKVFLDLKRDLLNFDCEYNLKSTDHASSSQFNKVVKCFKYGKLAIVCYKCKEKGHKVNACPNA